MRKMDLYERVAKQFDVLEVELAKLTRDYANLNAVCDRVRKDQVSGASGTGNGSGTGGSSGTGHEVRNPWRKESWNLTEQGRIVRENPALAARLKAEVQPEKWSWQVES